MINEVEQLAVFEYAACQTSQGVRRLLFGLRPGMTEREAVRLLDWNGMPLSCHLMLIERPAGVARAAQPGRPADRARRPVHRRLRDLGRAELPGRLRGRGRRRAAGRRSATTSSGSSARTSRRSPSGTARCAIGQTGGALQEIIDRRLGDPFFGIFLNPGHQIHLDEWVNSPIVRGSTIELRSGMALQVDIIPATGTDYFTTNIEDGVALADAALRDGLRGRLPGRLGADPGAPAVHGARRSGSTCTRTSCRSRTSPPTCRRSCSGRTAP